MDIDVELVSATSNLRLTTDVLQSLERPIGPTVAGEDPATRNLQWNTNIPRILIEGRPIQEHTAQMMYSPEPVEHAIIRAACQAQGIPSPVVAIDLSFSDMPGYHAGDQNLYARSLHGERHSNSMCGRIASSNDPAFSTRQDTELAVLCNNLTCVCEC